MRAMQSLKGGSDFGAAGLNQAEPKVGVTLVHLRRDCVNGDSGYLPILTLVFFDRDSHVFQRCAIRTIKFFIIAGCFCFL